MFAKSIHTEKIPEMLSDIEESFGWQALERMLNGGSKSTCILVLTQCS
jgi:hypothetical protein